MDVGNFIGSNCVVKACGPVYTSLSLSLSSQISVSEEIYHKVLELILSICEPIIPFALLYILYSGSIFRIFGHHLHEKSLEVLAQFRVFGFYGVVDFPKFFGLRPQNAI